MLIDCGYLFCSSLSKKSAYIFCQYGYAYWSVAFIYFLSTRIGLRSTYSFCLHRLKYFLSMYLRPYCEGNCCSPLLVVSVLNFLGRTRTGVLLIFSHHSHYNAVQSARKQNLEVPCSSSSDRVSSDVTAWLCNVCDVNSSFSGVKLSTRRIE